MLRASPAVRLTSALTPLALLLAGCASTQQHQSATPEATSYVVTPNPSAEVDAALARATANNTRVMLVMGANWCHDSRALAGWLATPRFQALVAEHYELVFINIGMPQTGDGHNIDIAQRFGLADLPGTPNLLVITADGTLVNVDTATTWRNAASRSEEAIYAELERLSASS
ncbi:thioredoxin family protein [Aurantiacibacter gilvus]|uniref:Thioredoxin family protein n=1 Tax=Aurantiacibacter gilvus TaxID=3139141 RepID=A0ABU9I9W5_9SPHN